MSPLKVGDTFPPATFTYIPYTPETSDIVACGTPAPFDAQKVLILYFSRLMTGIQGEESRFVCRSWSVYSRLSSETSPTLRREIRRIQKEGS
jgi:hypothetical protein